MKPSSIDTNVKKSSLRQLRERCKPITLVLFTSALVLDVLSSTGVTFDVAEIAAEYDIANGEASWALSAYALTFGAFLLFCGRLGDVLGHKNIFVSGLLCFALCSALIAGVHNAIAIFVLRAFQGISASMTVPTAYALVSTTYKNRARELALSVLGIGIASGSALGMIIGGAVTKSALGYRLLFWICFGLSLSLAIGSAILIPSSSKNLRLARNLDYMGAVLITSSLLLIVLGFTEAQESWSASTCIGPLVAGFATLGVFGVWDFYLLHKLDRSMEPLIPRRVWSYRDFSACLPITGLTYATCYLMLLNGSQFLVHVQNKSALISAVEFLPFTIAPLIMMPIFGVLHHKIDPKRIIAAGEIFIIGGIVIFSRNNSNTPYWHLTFPATILISVGTAAFFVNNVNIVVASCPPSDQGLISGILQSVAQASIAIAFSISTSFIGGARTDQLQGYRNSYYCAIGFSGVALLITVFLLSSRQSKEIVDIALQSN